MLRLSPRKVGANSKSLHATLTSVMGQKTYGPVGPSGIKPILST